MRVDMVFRRAAIFPTLRRAVKLLAAYLSAQGAGLPT